MNRSIYRTPTIVLAFLLGITQGCTTVSTNASVGNNTDDQLISNGDSVHGVIKIGVGPGFEYRSMSIEKECQPPCVELSSLPPFSEYSTIVDETKWKLKLGRSNDLLIPEVRSSIDVKLLSQRDRLTAAFAQHFKLASHAVKELFPNAQPLDLQLYLVSENTRVPLQLVTRKSATHIPLIFYVKVAATEHLDNEDAIEHVMTNAFNIAMHEYAHALRKEAKVEVDTMTEEIWAGVFEMTINLARIHHAYSGITGQLGLPDGIFVQDRLRSTEELVEAADQGSVDLGLSSKDDREYMLGLLLLAAQMAKIAELPSGVRAIELNDTAFIERLRQFAKARFYSNRRFQLASLDHYDSKPPARSKSAP